MTSVSLYISINFLLIFPAGELCAPQAKRRPFFLMVPLNLTEVLDIITFKPTNCSVRIFVATIVINLYGQTIRNLLEQSSGVGGIG